MSMVTHHQITCRTVQKSFSDYLDGAVTGREMQAITAHLSACSACSAEFGGWRAMQQTLMTLRAKLPPDLSLRLRVAISREQAARQAGWSDSLSLLWNNTLRPIALQGAAGLACAVTLIGTIAVLLGVVAPPSAVLANDEPLAAVTAPHYLYSVVRPRPMLLDARPATMVIEAAINDEGRVYDYSYISAPDGPDATAIRSQISDQLLLSVFKPASVFGIPVRGRIILTFAGVPLHR